MHIFTLVTALGVCIISSFLCLYLPPNLITHPVLLFGTYQFFILSVQPLPSSSGGVHWFLPLLLLYFVQDNYIYIFPRWWFSCSCIMCRRTNTLASTFTIIRDIFTLGGALTTYFYTLDGTLLAVKYPGWLGGGTVRTFRLLPFVTDTPPRVTLGAERKFRTLGGSFLDPILLALYLTLFYGSILNRSYILTSAYNFFSLWFVVPLVAWLKLCRALMIT